jgi:hypothetical protein
LDAPGKREQVPRALVRGLHLAALDEQELAVAALGVLQRGADLREGRGLAAEELAEDPQ